MQSTAMFLPRAASSRIDKSLSTYCTPSSRTAAPLARQSVTSGLHALCHTCTALLLSVVSAAAAAAAADDDDDDDDDVYVLCRM